MYLLVWLISTKFPFLSEISSFDPDSVIEYDASLGFSFRELHSLGLHSCPPDLFFHVFTWCHRSLVISMMLFNSIASIWFLFHKHNNNGFVYHMSTLFLLPITCLEHYMNPLFMEDWGLKGLDSRLLSPSIIETWLLNQNHI